MRERFPLLEFGTYGLERSSSASSTSPKEPGTGAVAGLLAHGLRSPVVWKWAGLAEGFDGLKIGKGGPCGWRGDDCVDDEREVLAEGTENVFGPEAVGVLGPSEELLDFVLLRGVSGVDGVEGVEGTEKRAIALVVAAVSARSILQRRSAHPR